MKPKTSQADWKMTDLLRRARPEQREGLSVHSLAYFLFIESYARAAQLWFSLVALPTNVFNTAVKRFPRRFSPLFFFLLFFFAQKLKIIKPLKQQKNKKKNK